MPEIISKYPDITLDLLKSSGAKCGEGIVQKILTKCPPERFCSMPNGEICVYGIDEIDKMTQVSVSEIIPITKIPPPQISLIRYSVIPILIILPIIAFIILLIIGRYKKNRM